MTPDQPRLTLERTWRDLALEGLAVAAWLSGLTVVLLSWREMPERVPMHFDLEGEPTRWGPRSEFLVLPAISFVVLIGLAILTRFPHRYNYLVAINEQNAPRQYRLAVRLLQSLNVLLQSLFAVIVWTVIRAASGVSHPGIWFVPALVAGTFVLLIIYLVKATSEPSHWRSS